MSPKVDRIRHKTVYRCDLCNKEFDTKHEETIHEICDHFGYSATMNFSSVL